MDDDNEDCGGSGDRRFGRLVVMAGHIERAKQKKSDAVRKKRKYVRRDTSPPAVTQANVMMTTQSNINLLAKLLEGKNAPLVVILIIVVFVGYGVFTLAQDFRKDMREDMSKLTDNVSELTQAVKELKPRLEKQQAMAN